MFEKWKMKPKWQGTIPRDIEKSTAAMEIEDETIYESDMTTTISRAAITLQPMLTIFNAACQKVAMEKNKKERNIQLMNFW